MSSHMPPFHCPRKSGLTPGNYSNAKTEEQVVQEARDLVGWGVSNAARKIGIGWNRLAALNEKYGLGLVVRKKAMSDEDILKLMDLYKDEDTYWSMHLRTGINHNRIRELAIKHGVKMLPGRTADKRGLFYNEDGYAMKTCSCCGLDKGAEFFREDQSKALSGLTSWCKDCLRGKHKTAEASPWN